MDGAAGAVAARLHDTTLRTTRAMKQIPGPFKKFARVARAKT
jgi:hypothetical protein